MQERLDKYLNKFARSPNVGDLKVLIETPQSRYLFESKGARPRHFIASSTKLFTNALIFKLIESGNFNLNTPVAELLGAQTLHGLVDEQYVGSVEIEHLLRHTSGIADYFGDAPPGGKSLMQELVTQDRKWDFEQALDRTRQLKKVGAPGQRAHYSDTNYQLLGRVIEQSHGASYAQVFENILAKPLGLSNTFVMTSAGEAAGVSIMKYGEREWQINEAMSSFKPDGGVVSDLSDSLKFLRAYYDGSLFSEKFSDPTRQVWRKIFNPLEYGLGQMKFALPVFMTGFRKANALYGHSGASGHVMFFDPLSASYFVATVNQAKNRSLVFRMLVNLQLRAR